MTDNQLQKKDAANGAGVAAFLRNPTVVERTKALLNEGAGDFTAGLLAAVNTNPTLAQCSPVTVYNAALAAASLKLPINSNLGLAYLVPYQNNKKIVGEDGKERWAKVWEAQLQIGWKGFVQLAQRSGQYKRIACTPVYEGQLISEDPLMGNEYDWKAKKSEKIVGYISRFELLNGFTNDFYMTAEQAEAHGARYSQSFKSDKQYGNSKSLWSTDFDKMALKTVIKLNISKWGPMSVEMQKAVEIDQTVIKDDGTPEYIDGETVQTDDDRKARIQAAAQAKAAEMKGAEHMPAAVDTVVEVTDEELEQLDEPKK